LVRGLFVTVAVLAVAATLAGESARGRKAGLVIAVAALALPFLEHTESPLMAFVVALVACWGAVRTLDLYRERTARPWRMRVWHVLAAFDTRQTTRVPARVDGATLMNVLGHAALATGGAVVLLYGAPHLLGFARWPVRAVAGTAFAYGVAGAVADLVRWMYLLVGIAVPPIQRTPIASRSLQEFWGQRWNRVVGRWLRENLFLPLARRRRPAVGLLLAFVVSGFLHGYLTLAAVGSAMALPMTAFFVVQGGLVLLERGLRVEAWPSAAARLWFVTAMLVSVPLFVEPMLAVVLPAANP
jgi:hypothetical protein